MGVLLGPSVGLFSILAPVTEERAMVVMGLVRRRVSLNGKRGFGEALERLWRRVFVKWQMVEPYGH